jgi:hypothetical protein
MLLRIAAPPRFFDKAPEFWRNDHTHGVLEMHIERALGTVCLGDHPYTQTPQMRLAIAEIFRYTVQRMRARNVTETHALEPDGALTIRIRWE